jgi:micrococcal nuclease
MPIEDLIRLALAGAWLGACAAGGHVAGSESSAPTGACIVGRIVDGDTFYCRNGRKVRLLGIDGPERGQGSAGRQARRALARLLPSGRAVRLVGGAAPRDRHGRVLAYAWVGGAPVNETVVRRSRPT